MPSVSRSLTNKVITCEASNTALVPPRRASLQLELVLTPDRLELHSGEERIVVLGEVVTLTCTARGARPLPTILWLAKHIVSQEELRYQVWEGGGRWAISRLCTKDQCGTKQVYWFIYTFTSLYC